MSKVGREVAGQVGTAARDLGGTRALVVGDATMERAGYVDAVERALAGAGIASARYAGVNTEPTDAHCEEGLAVLRESGADVVVAVGGGSPIDTAKAVAALATNPGAIADFRGTDKIARPRLPLVAIPTTAGTG
ncbi:MAG: iron-containing alcohol dehydrogenase, partial [Chloroflexi bacterium]|nr:iron-containing alcohol dehydrogenase [Chloroflexota bacterium]